MPPVLTVILCVYNEMGRLQPALDELLASMSGREEEVEVLVVDNVSTDGTREWLRTFAHPSVTVVLNERNLGKGGSIKKALQLSRGRWVVIHDPDLEYRAKDLWPLLDEARRTGAGLALGSRTLGGQARYKYLQNYLGVLVLTGLIRVLYGCRITDAATAMKLMDGDLARRLRLECHGFDLDFELVTRIVRLGRSVAEVPIDYQPRTKAEGKKIRAWRDGLSALRPILGDRFRRTASFVLPGR